MFGSKQRRQERELRQLYEAVQRTGKDVIFQTAKALEAAIENGDTAKAKELCRKVVEYSGWLREPWKPIVDQDNKQRSGVAE